MTHDDRPAFDVQMQRLSAAFTPLPEDAIEAYFQALNDLSVEQVCIAVGRAVSELRSTRPGPVVLRELVLGTSQQREALAWSTVKRLVALPCCRDFTLGICDALLIAVAVKVMGGWNILEDRITLDSTRQEFLSIYRDLVYEERHDLLGVSPDEMRRMQRSVANERHRVGLMALPVPQTLVNAGVVDPIRAKELTADREAEQIDNLRTILAAAGQGGLG